MAADLTYVRDYVTSLAGVETTTSYGHETWTVKGAKFAWRRPFSKADIRRYGDQPIPAGELIAVATIDVDDRNAIVAEGKPGFFVIEHIAAYPIYLVQLDVVAKRHLKAALFEAWQAKASE